MDNHRVDSKKLKDFCQDVFITLGAKQEDADVVANNLVEAELRGLSSHGVSRIQSYAANLEKGLFNTNPNIKILKECNSVISIDADYALGAVSGTMAMSMCIEKAKKTGAAFAGVSKGSHFGIAAFYSMMALKEDMIGIAMCNSGKIMSVYGGISRVLGTNPISVAIPTGKRYPVVHDGATSEVAFGKIMVAFIEGKDIPEGWAIDKSGKPTTDPKEAFNGVSLPFGGYKGSGIAIIVNVFSAILSGAILNSGSEKSENYGNHSNEIGFFFGAFDISKFQDVNVFKAGMDQMIDAMKASAKYDNSQEIYMPGELEYIRKEENLKYGIEIGRGVLNDLAEIQKTLKLTRKIEDLFI